MVLKYFQSKLLKSIYAKHNLSNEVLIVYEDTKGKTKYKISRNTTDKEFTYNGFGHYIMLVQQFYINGYHSNSTIEKMFYDFRRKKIKHDILEILDKLIKLFN